MLWSRLTTAVFLAVTLTACGFKPLYAPTANAPGAKGFPGVYVAQVPDRIGQQFRNALVDMINPSGTTEKPTHVLKATLVESQATLAVQKTASATRANTRMEVSFTLQDLNSNQIVWTGSSVAVASHNILDSQYATLKSLENVRARSVRKLAEDVRVRLGIYFHRADTTGGAQAQ